MTLREAQCEFTRCVSKLIAFATDCGYELTFAEAYRPPAQAMAMAQSGRGIVRSLHIKRLAVDFNLFRNGSFLTDTHSHKVLGDYWTTLHPLARWGGDFSKPDGNHYSLEWEGVK